MIALSLLRPILFTAMKIVSGIVFLLTIISAYGGHVNPQYFALPAMMSLVLPYFAIMTMLLTIFWACFRKIIFTGLGVLTIFICMPPLSQAVPLGSKKSAGNDEDTFKIISWNVCHSVDVRYPGSDGSRTVEYMLHSGADVICLAELNNFSTHEFNNTPQPLIDSLFAVYPYRKGTVNTDIKIMARYPIEEIQVPKKNKGKIDYLFFRVKFPNRKNLTVGVAHLYSYELSEQERQVVAEIKSIETAKESVKEFKGSIYSKLKEAFRMRSKDAEGLREIIDSIPLQEPLIICGDFNDVPTSWAYNLIRGEDMRDAYAETNIGPAFTYNLHRFYFHIDQMLYRGNLEALRLDVGKIDSSDHYPLIGEFEFKKN